ncbi:Signal transducer regulating beta-lactamase production, contains metallopeptidase domain [Algoriphagus locisalis]|uniref:Signal transducer regulating beta-lactamase production, contains metallopeptidase domain n=1 Tax=Algoriphagus locisalis TaxID=305507 RepID=A0A1I7CWP8_9BACT|nr:M56 family metallopeptidase [Algoriphagus locisalis]SFU03796.1 Signal transducer regulating beta-lactamase production, contains metallopeptidase domain [Algoriphagus locisalis]
MDLLNDWIAESILYATGWTLVHSLWQLVIISASFWLLLKIFGKQSTAFKYNLGLGALGLTLLTALGTFFYELSIYTPTPLFERLNMAFVPAESLNTSSGYETDGLINVIIGWIELQLPLLVNFWFLGALLFLFRLFNSLSEIRTLRKSSTDPQDFQLEKTLYRLMGKMDISKNVELRLTSYCVSPVTFGYLKPIILIPAGLIFQLTPVQLEAIIAHELAHVKRNDYLINLFQSALEVLFFYHPCYWWMNQTVKELRENAADDLAVQVGVVPKELAYSLAEVLNFAKQNPPELALAAGKRRNPTLQRIKRILGHPAQTYPQNPIISIPMLLTLLLSAGLMATAQQDASVAVEKMNPVTVDVNAEMQAIAEVEKNINANVNSNIDNNVNVFLDTIIDNEVKKVVITDGKPTYVNSKNQIVEYQYAKPEHVLIKGDTIITKGDTVILKSRKKGTYVYHRNGEMVVLDDMPELELAPVPPFPGEAMAPVMDFAMAPMPPMEFGMAPVPDFDMSEMPEMVFEMGDHPMIFEFDGKNGLGFFFDADTIKNMTPEEKEKWAKNVEKRSAEWAKAAELNAAKWEAHQEEFGAKMEEWQKAMEPKLKEFEKKMAEWQNAYEPKMKEFEAKMKAWQESNEPKLKEYEEKMKAWEKEMQPKMEEYQRKMEVWQQENAAKIEAYQKKIEEELKKKEDNK